MELEVSSRCQEERQTLAMWDARLHDQTERREILLILSQFLKGSIKDLPTVEVRSTNEMHSRFFTTDYIMLGRRVATIFPHLVIYLEGGPFLIM